MIPKILSKPHTSRTLDKTCTTKKKKKKTLQRAPVWYRSKTLRKLS